MDITRHLLCLVLLHLAGFCYLVYSSKKNKLPARPHGWHVADKRGWSTLFDPQGLNTSARVATGNSGKAMIEPKIVSVEPLGNKLDSRRKKKRRKMNKKFSDYSVFSQAQYELINSRRKCKNWADCNKDECCIRHRGTKGHCKKRPQKGDRCKPALLPGLESCPCDKGLTCKSYKKTRWGKRKHRCQLLSVTEDEIEQKYL